MDLTTNVTSVALAITAADATATVSLDGGGATSTIALPTPDAVVTVPYTITDSNGDTSTATLTIPVTPVNDVPLAVSETVAAVLEDSGAVTYPVLGNGDTFGGDGPYTTDLLIGAVVGGTATLDNGGTPNDPTDDQIVFTPAPNFNITMLLANTIESAARSAAGAA